MDLVRNRNRFFLFSALVVLAGMVSLVIPGGLRAGIEFTGGSTLSLTFAQPVEQTQLRQAMVEEGYPEAVIQNLGGNAYFIRTRELKAEALGGQTSERDRLVAALETRLGTIEQEEFFSVAPAIARRTVVNATIAVVVAAAGILLYITWAFRRVPSPFRYGVCAVVALAHDVLVVLGLYSLLARWVNLEVSAMFITALLTVVGYSVHDTIVVFDRIRENVGRGLSRDLATVVNVSLLETMARSLNTSLTLLFTILALLLFGGPTIRDFLVVLFIGVVFGTYSSICLASQMLVTWERGEFTRLLRRLRLLPARA